MHKKTYPNLPREVTVFLDCSYNFAPCCKLESLNLATLDFSFTLIMWRLGPIFSKRNPLYLSHLPFCCENSPNFLMETIIDLLIVRHKMQTNSVRIHQWDAHLIPFTLLSTVPCFLILQAAAQQRLVHVCSKETAQFYSVRYWVMHSHFASSFLFEAKIAAIFTLFPLIDTFRLCKLLLHLCSKDWCNTILLSIG